MSQILGMNSNAVYAFIITIILVVLGIVSFHYFSYITTENNATFNAGFGANFKFLPQNTENFEIPNVKVDLCKTCKNCGTEGSLGCRMCKNAGCTSEINGELKGEHFN